MSWRLHAVLTRIASDKMIIITATPRELPMLRSGGNRASSHCITIEGTPMRRVINVLPLLLLPFILYNLAAQRPIGGWESGALAKCDARLKIALAKGPARSTAPPLRVATVVPADSFLHLFVTGDPAAIIRLAREAGGVSGSVVGNLVTVSVPWGAVPAIASSPLVERLELAVPIRYFNDSARAAIRADAAQRGLLPLTESYTGEGVILGVIDSGIDFRHPEFRKLRDSLRTRVIDMWGQGVGSGRKPNDYGYGTEWGAEEIQAAIGGGPTGPVDEEDYVGHGTHVAATAAGCHGMAPDADIILVQLRNLWLDDDFASEVLDAATYIFDRATAMGRPCVINASLGTYDHPQDGSDPLSRGIDALVAAHPGRFFCAAAGNSGGAMQHWESLGGSADSSWIYSSSGQVSFRVPDSSLGHFELAVLFDSLGYMDSHATPLCGGMYRSGSLIRNAGIVVDTMAVAISDDPRIVRIAWSSLGNGYSEIVLNADLHMDDLLRLSVRGGSPFHSWSNEFYDRGRARVDDTTYASPDDHYTLGSPAIGRHVLAVGSYVNRTHYVDQRGDTLPTVPLTAGDVSIFTSRGPTTDGRIKPDLAAPGTNVISARSRDIVYPDRTLLVSDPLLMVLSGTSMASPAASGAVALYLQKHPDATDDEIRSAFTSHARHDGFTDRDGRGPDGTWGYGKLDAFAAISADEPPSSYGQSGVHLFDPLPNPVAAGRAIIRYRIDRPGDVVLSVYTIIGQHMVDLVDEHEDAGSHERGIDMSGWPPGTYRLELHSNGARDVGKILLLH